MSKENKPRLSVLLNADSVGTLAKYKANGQTATETVRQSLALYDFLMREVEPDYRFSNDVWDFWVLIGVPEHADGSAHCSVYWYDRDVYQWKSKVFDIDCEKYLSEDDVFEHEAFDFLTFDVFQGDSSAASQFVKFMTIPDKFSSALLYNKVSQNLGYRVVFPGFGGVITY